MKILRLALFVLAGCATSQQVPVQYYAPSQTAPYSDAVRAGDLLFISGKLGTLPGQSAVVPGGIMAETRQALENIKAIVEANGSSMDRVVKCTVMLADVNEWDDMNTVYRTYFPANKPARSSFGVSGLARGARVEIECIALAAGGKP